MIASRVGPPVHWPTLTILASGIAASLFAHYRELSLQTCLEIFTAFGLVALGWYWYAASWQMFPVSRLDWTGPYALVSGVLLFLMGVILLAIEVVHIPLLGLAATFLVYALLRLWYVRKLRRA